MLLQVFLILSCKHEGPGDCRNVPSQDDNSWKTVYMKKGKLRNEARLSEQAQAQAQAQAEAKVDENQRLTPLTLLYMHVVTLLRCSLSLQNASSVLSLLNVIVQSVQGSQKVSGH